MRRGRAGEADAGPHEGIRQPDLPVRDPLLPHEQHREEAQETQRVAGEEGEPSAFRLDELGRAGGDQHHEECGRQDREPRIEGVIGEHVLQELLADEHRSHQRAEHDDARACRDPEHAAAGDVKVVQRVAGTALADDERDSCGEHDRRESQHQASGVRDRCEVDPEHERRNQHDGEDPAEVVDRIASLVHVSWNVAEGEQQGNDGKR